jgi:hypothetical protein
VASIAYDRWGFPEFERTIGDAGVTLPKLVEHGQGWKDQSPSLAALELEMIEHRLPPTMGYAAGEPSVWPYGGGWITS